MKKQLAIFLAIICSVSVYSQAGKGVYQTLNLPMDARTIGLGGTNVSVYDGDLNLAFNNPALLSSMSHNMLTLNYARWLAEINVGSVGYSRAFGKNNENIWAFGVNYFDYGNMLGYDEYGVYTGLFTAKDINLNLMYARALTKGFTVAGNLKPIFSAYELYSSAGVALDLGAHYHNDSLGLSVGLALKNIGFQFNPYDEVREKLPFNILFGFSAKFKHAPIRLSLTLHNLQRWDLGYERSSLIDLEYNKQNNVKWYDMLFRHAIISAEIMPHKNFFLSAAFNWRRRAEMDIPDLRSMAGFSFGAGLKVHKFQAGFSLTQFQKGTFTYHVTLSTNLSDFGIDDRRIKQPKQPKPEKQLTEKELQKQQENLQKEQEKQAKEQQKALEQQKKLEEKQKAQEEKNRQKEEERLRKEQEKQKKESGVWVQ